MISLWQCFACGSDIGETKETRWIANHEKRCFVLVETIVCQKCGTSFDVIQNEVSAYDHLGFITDICRLWRGGLVDLDADSAIQSLRDIADMWQADLRDGRVWRENGT